MLTNVRLTSAGSLLVSVFLYWASSSHGAADSSYVMPRMIATAMIVLSVALLVISFTRQAEAEASEASIPWGSIFPALVIFIAYLMLAKTLGFFTTSFLAFVALGLIYAPGRTTARNAAVCVGSGLAFMVALYVVFVALLNVQLPGGILI